MSTVKQEAGIPFSDKTHYKNDTCLLLSPQLCS